MKRVLKWFLMGFGGLLALVLLVIAVVYVFVGSRLGSTFDIAAAENITLPDDEALVPEGKRLATLRGCNNGCHGEVSNGEIFFEIPDGTRVVAPDLAHAVNQYSTEDFLRLVRHGVRPDGTSLIGIMPSEMFYNLSDDDITAIIAYLRSQSPREDALPESRLGPIIRLMLLYFDLTEGGLLAAESIDHTAPRLAPLHDQPREHGKYLAKTICTECHGPDLGGLDGVGAPTLAIVAAYSREEFATLMRTGIPIGGRKLDLMEEVALKRFAYFTDSELDDLYAYLGTLASARAP